MSQSGRKDVERARDELFSHIHRCGVLKALPEHQVEWMDETIEYIAERYPELGRDALGHLVGVVDGGKAGADVEELADRLKRTDGRLPVVAGGDGSVHALIAAAHRLGRLGGTGAASFDFGHIFRILTEKG